MNRRCSSEGNLIEIGVIIDHLPIAKYNCDFPLFQIDTRNRADSAVYASERMLKESGDKLPVAEKAEVEAAMKALRTAIDGNDAAAIAGLLEKLTAAQHKAAEALYRAQAASGAAEEGAPGPEAGGPAGGGASDQGDVIDAEVVDDKK